MKRPTAMKGSGLRPLISNMHKTHNIFWRLLFSSSLKSGPRGQRIARVACHRRYAAAAPAVGQLGSLASLLIKACCSKDSCSFQTAFCTEEMATKAGSSRIRQTSPLNQTRGKQERRPPAADQPLPSILLNPPRLPILPIPGTCRAHAKCC